MSMLEAARDLLEALDPARRARATFPFDAHAERTDWLYFPREQHGLPLGELTHAQSRLVHSLLSTALSFEAYTRANTVIGIENVLWQREGERSFDRRDPGRYALSIFGEPGPGPWGWRFQGHHISLHFTLRGEQVLASSPLFLGSNPARLQHEGHDILRPFADAEDRARELLDALTPEQRAIAVIHPEAPIDILLGVLPHPSTPFRHQGIPGVHVIPTTPEQDRLMALLRADIHRPAGIPAERLTPGQRELLAGLLTLYAHRLAPPARWPGSDALKGLHFAWAGPREPGLPHYYRLHGPDILIEYDNAQNDGNHVHTVARHPRNDFAAEALALHWQHWHLPEDAPAT